MKHVTKFKDIEIRHTEVSLPLIVLLLKKHQMWLDGNEKIGKKADFSFTTIKDVTLNKRDLRNIDFSGARLINVQLNSSDLRNCDFRYTWFEKVDISFADMRNTFFNEETLNFRGEATSIRFDENNLLKKFIDENVTYFTSSNSSCYFNGIR